MKKQIQSIFSKVSSLFSKFDEEHIKPKTSERRSFFRSALVKGGFLLSISLFGLVYSVNYYYEYTLIEFFINTSLILAGLYGGFELLICIYSYVKYSRFLPEDQITTETKSIIDFYEEQNENYMCKLNDYQIDKNSSKLASKRANHSSKNKTTAALLAIFLGSFGIHKFYLSKVSGLWYLLFFWTWIPMLIGFIEGVFLLLMDEVEFDQKYNKENSLRRNSKYVESQIDQIERLADLKEKGLISEEEFHKTKNKILDS